MGSPRIRAIQTRRPLGPELAELEIRSDLRLTTQRGVPPPMLTGWTYPHLDATTSWPIRMGTARMKPPDDRQRPILGTAGDSRYHRPRVRRADHRPTRLPWCLGQ